MFIFERQAINYGRQSYLQFLRRPLHASGSGARALCIRNAELQGLRHVSHGDESPIKGI